MEQMIIRASEEYKELDQYLKGNDIRSFLLVCDGSLRNLRIDHYFKNLEARTGIKVERFSEFKPNPDYGSIVEGVERFKSSACDSIIVIGGGSAIDVAKCIKLYSSSECEGTGGAYLSQPIVKNNIKLLAIPTTAGTGAEATRYAVVYYKGEKQSITDYSIIPDTVLFDSSVLKTLPLYQKKSTMLDALCHGIESYWSVNSTEESKRYSKDAIRLILDNKEGYLANEDAANERMQKAAYIAGKAINITQTTAGHAMCYKLTSLYGIAHGHAAALCVKELWPWMIENVDKCVDPRGQKYLEDVFLELGALMGGGDPMSAAHSFIGIVKQLEMNVPIARENDHNGLKTSVNPIRLNNNPVGLGTEDIDYLYHRIFSEVV